MPKASKLQDEYPSVKYIKNKMKQNPEIKIDQIYGFDRRARNSPFILELVKIIQQLHDENFHLRCESD